MGVKIPCKDVTPFKKCPYIANGFNLEDAIIDLKKHVLKDHQIKAEEFNDPKMIEAINIAAKEV